MMIAAHAVATAATLVTRDKAFAHISEPLKVDDWTGERS
jgi:tRNA(fMet)-specific endonuclease VapC